LVHVYTKGALCQRVKCVSRRTLTLGGIRARAHVCMRARVNASKHASHSESR